MKEFSIQEVQALMEAAARLGVSSLRLADIEVVFGEPPLAAVASYNEPRPVSPLERMAEITAEADAWAEASPVTPFVDDGEI